MAALPTTQPGDSLSDILRGMWRRKLFVLSLWLLGSAAGYAATQIIDPVYLTEAQILIGNSDMNGERASPNANTANRGVLDERTVQSELAVLNSNDMAMRVIAELELTNLPSYNPKLRPVTTVKAWLIKLGFSEDPAKLTPEQLALAKYRAAATIYQLPESNVIGIKMRTGDPENAALVANKIAETYVKSTQELQARNTDETKGWLELQITGLRSKVASAEAEVEKFRSDKGLVETQNSTLSEQETAAVNAQITAAEAAEAEASARAQEIKELLASSGSVDASTEVLNSATVATLRDRQLGAQQKLSELSATYLDNHPRMIAARQELRDVERQLRREALKIVDSLDGQANIAAKQAQGLRNKLDDLKARQTATGQDEAKLKELEREATANRALLENMLTRYADANASKDVSIKPPYARVIQQADVPASIYFPKKGPLVLLASLAGLLTGLGIAFLAEMMRAAARLSTIHAGVAYEGTERRLPGVDRRADLSNPPELVQQPMPVSPLKPRPPASQLQPLPQPSITSIPKRPVVVPPNYASPQTPQAKTEGAEPRDKSMATTSETAVQLGEALIKLKSDFNIFASRFSGQTKFKTDVALFVVATARALTEQKKKVLVIDADPMSHALEPLFDLEQAAGLSDLVSGATDFTKIIRKDSQSSAHVIGFGLTQTTEAIAAVEDRMATILSNLEGVYDVVLLHAGDATPTTHHMLLGCKSVVMIVPQSEKRDLTAAEQAIHDLGAESVMHVTLMQETILS